jgi:hypothetical protein
MAMLAPAAQQHELPFAAKYYNAQTDLRAYRIEKYKGADHGANL